MPADNEILGLHLTKRVGVLMLAAGAHYGYFDLLKEIWYIDTPLI